MKYPNLFELIDFDTIPRECSWLYLKRSTIFIAFCTRGTMHMMLHMIESYARRKKWSINYVANLVGLELLVLDATI